MTRKEKAERIQRQLEDLYPETPIPLDHSDPFTLLIAVLLSAQTTDKKVNEVTPALFRRASTPQEMATLSVEEIHGLIRQIGLANSKAKNIRRLSEMLVEAGGEVPQTFEELEALPGVGHKTASVVMAQAFGVPAFPVDTHIHRLAARWGLSNGKNVAKTEEDLKKIFPRESWNSLHLQIIFFGREYCPALYHDLSQCPICSWAATKKRIREEEQGNLQRRRRK
ncbi:MAG: endonuclease III [Acidobacteriota bacterium]